MILDTNRLRKPLKQWRYLLFPVMFICIVAWLVIPAAISQLGFQTWESNSAMQANTSARPVVSTLQNSQPPPMVDKNTLWIDTVKRGPMVLQVRGTGVLLAADGAVRKVKLEIAGQMGKEIQMGQPASVDTHGGILSGRVVSIDSAANGVIAVVVSLEGNLPAGAQAGLKVDGTIQTGRLEDALYVSRPIHSQRDSNGSLFKLAGNGKTAVRAKVKYGKTSVSTIQIVDGLKVGEKVILSDMSAHDGVNLIQLK